MWLAAVWGVALASVFLLASAQHQVDTWVDMARPLPVDFRGAEAPAQLLGEPTQHCAHEASILS